MRSHCLDTPDSTEDAPAIAEERRMPTKIYIDGMAASGSNAVPDDAEGFCFEAGTMQIFTDEKKKAEWLNSTGYSVYYQRGLARVRDLKKRKAHLMTEEAKFSAALKAEEEQGRKLIEDLIRKHNVDPSDSKAFARFMPAYEPQSEPRQLSAYLYNGVYTGSWRWVPNGAYIPYMGGLYGFDNKTTSVYAFGATLAMYNKAWFDGGSAWIGGHPFREQDFTGLWFNNRATSLVCF